MDSDISVLLNSFNSYFSKKFSLSDSELSCILSFFLSSSDTRDSRLKSLGMSKNMYYSILIEIKYKLGLESEFSDSNVSVVYFYEFVLFLLSSSSYLANKKLS